MLKLVLLHQVAEAAIRELEQRGGFSLYAARLFHGFEQHGLFHVGHVLFHSLLRNADGTTVAIAIRTSSGSFRARAVVGATVKAGVVVTQGIWWNKYTSDGVNCNTTTSTRLTDLGAGATFFDNLVEVTAEA